VLTELSLSRDHSLVVKIPAAEKCSFSFHRCWLDSQ